MMFRKLTERIIDNEDITSIKEWTGISSRHEPILFERKYAGHTPSPCLFIHKKFPLNLILSEENNVIGKRIQKAIRPCDMWHKKPIRKQSQ